MAEESSATLFLKRAGMVLGAATGITVLAFCAGFLARRAQFAIADIPFVFVDYWAYAETGFLGLVQTTYLILESPWPIVIVALLTIAIFLALELDSFRRFVLRPHVAFGGSLAVILVGAILVRQQLAVLHTSDASASAERVASKGDGETLRTVAPFSWLVATPLELPPALPTDFPQDSMDAWDVMAKELDLRASRAPSAMEVRPLRGWVSVISRENSGVSMEKEAIALEKGEGGGATTLIGLSAPIEQLEASRARELYRLLALWGLLTVWGVLVLHLWLKRVRSDMTPTTGSDPTTRIQKILVRLREEIWFSSWYVTRPLALGLAVTSSCFLLPECYGSLALPHIGEERVEVVVRKADDKHGGQDKQDFATLVSSDRTERVNWSNERKNLMSLVVEADQYHFSDIDKRREIEYSWAEKIGEFAAEANEDAERFLRSVSVATRQSAPQLSAIAHDAWIRVSSEIGTSRVGHILHYPRSEGEYLRLLTRFDASSGSRWTILPIKTEDILEVRVQESSEDKALAHTLRQMRSLDAEGRNQAIIEIELPGHPNVLEVMLAGMFDRSPIVQGPAITAVGRYAASMPETAIGELRRRRAAEILLRVVEDSTKPARFRGTAATALHIFAAGECESAAERLLQVLRDPSNATFDKDWEIRGTIMTSLAKMHHAPAVESLLAILKGDLGDRFLPPPPQSVLISIPSALRSIGEPQRSVPTLAKMLNDPTTRSALHGPIIAALGGLGSRGVDESAAALVQYLKTPKRGDVNEEKLADSHQAAMLSLRLIGDPIAVPTIHQMISQRRSIAQDVEYEPEVQITAVYVLMSIDDNSSEPVLLDMVVDASNTTELRAASAIALGRFDGAEATEKLRDLANDQIAKTKVALSGLDQLAEDVPDLQFEVWSAKLALLKNEPYVGTGSVAAVQKNAIDATHLFKAILDALKARGDQGSGRAASYYGSLEGKQPLAAPTTGIQGTDIESMLRPDESP